MTGWNRAKSAARISSLMASVPSAKVAVRTFDAPAYALRKAQLIKRALTESGSEDLIFNVSPSEAVRVDAVHVYVQLVDYEAAMLDIRNETDAGHHRLLQMLHLHYAACDGVAEAFEAQRVDYHGPRMHAVIVSPPGPENERERVLRALEFADAVTRTIEQVGQTVGTGNYRTRVRVGIDSGPAAAVNSGRASEPEPLFLGSAANYAAKLAEGSVPGVYPSSRVRHGLAMPLPMAGFEFERAQAMTITEAEGVFPTRRIRAADDLVRRAVEQVEGRFGRGAELPVFQFHRHEPPLRSIDFKALSPSSAIRMELLSIFGDVDGFTRYVDECIARGAIADMVASFHVIRGEMAACLKEDFDGRKIRFIGDCIHGVLAEGDRVKTDAPSSVRVAVAAAAGMRSSFELCQELLPTIGNLGLAIGVEFGSTPITRIGLRGERSVRCCVSKAVSASEDLQRSSPGNGTRLGERALLNAPVAVRRIFDATGLARDLDYASFLSHVSPPAIVASGSVVREARPHLG